jgi:beta-phosphoglucomutase family hydrolase
MKENHVQAATAVLPVEGVIFDMDGTLLESTQADYLAWKWVFADFDYDLSFQDYMPMLGIRSADLLRHKLQLSGDTLQNALTKKMAYFREIVNGNGIHPVPYVELFLQHVRSFPVRIALATSSRKEKMQLLMEKMEWLHFFDAIVTGEEVHHGKPAPDIFLLAAERLGLPPSSCIVFEDAASGVAAAKKAQMKCVAITTTHSAEQLAQADLVVDSYEHADLKDWCRLAQ